jgi:hypothetical protein
MTTLLTWRRIAAPVLLLVLPLVINAVALGDWLSANPIHWMSGLNVVRPNAHLLIRGFPGWVDGNAGVTTQALGHLAADQWLHGHVPWWNAFSGIGLPLAAEMQNSALFLPFVLLLHFSNGLIYLKVILEIVAGWGMYALTRQLSIGTRAALIGAVLFQFNGTFAWFSHGPIMPVAFLPWLLFGIERARAAARQARSGGWGWIAVAIGFSVVASFPETAYLDGLLGLTFAAYRIATYGAGRGLLVLKIIAGGLVGLMLSAPASVPFLEFASAAYVGPHADFSGSRLLAESYALLLFPYVYGPIHYGNEMINESAAIWWHTGGYCGLMLVFLATLGLARGSGKDAGLRLMLAGWVVLTLAKAAGVQPIAGIIDMIPFIRQTMFFNYITPSWQACLALLAAYALDDWHAGPVPSRWWRHAPVMAAGTCLLMAAAVLTAARGEIHMLVGSIPAFAVFPLGAIGMTTASMLIAASILSNGPTQWRSLVLGCVTGITSLALYGFPLLSGTRNRALNEQPIAFLREHLGLSRFYAAPFPQPNYGAYYQIAGVNHNYLPVPQNWVDYLHTHINPVLDGAEFHGDGLAASNVDIPVGQPAPNSMIPAAKILDAFKNLAVRYLVLPAGAAPFGEWIGSDISFTDQHPFPLENGQGFTMARAPVQVSTGIVLDAGLQIGTYAGHASGLLTITLCDGSNCASGAIDTATARDNQVAWARLDRPLPVAHGDALRASVAFRGSSRVAVWLWPRTSDSAIIGPDVASPAHIPFLSLHLNRDGLTPPLVYRDAQIDIRELAQPSDYFTTISGQCRLTPVSRTDVSADCSSPDTLIRRELYFPGWHAMAGDRDIPIVAYDKLFQAIAVPAGHTDLRFAYQPPGIIFCYAAFGAGLLALGGLIGLGRKESASFWKKKQKLSAILHIL